MVTLSNIYMTFKKLIKLRCNFTVNPKKPNIINIKINKMKKLIPLAVLLALTCSTTFAQEGKLKNVQTNSILAPANVKVDGNLKEWDDTFQAYNKTTKVFYTVCNDDKYIYFVLKSIDIPNNAKIIGGGITFTINTDDKKKEKDAYSLTFPVVATPTRGPGGRGGGRGGFGGGGNAGADSAAIAARHKQIVTNSKEIKVSGFKDITDTLISIYNEYSIKAAIGYDALGNYDYELAIPLKALNLSLNDAKEFAYNVKINGRQMPPVFGGGSGFGGGDGGGGGFGGGGRGGRGGGGGGAAIIPGGRNDPEMYSPTDFWGKYSLAKK
jgi:uncharacterized membrane protein YgcG